MKIEPCTIPDMSHAWLPITGEVLQYYSCPACNQRIYWSEILKRWVRNDPTGKDAE